MRINEPRPTGGKAGKGKNKTSTVRVMDENNCIIKSFRYQTNKADSYHRAWNKAVNYILANKQEASDERS